jgi:isopentenyl diphosphate isomerase/L-lactate dehydrogenase-like FMN-dependent dehydrogenase
MPVEAPSFLSYSRKDYYFAESLAFHLMRQGVPVWLDVRDLEPGKDWERELEDALDAAPTVVLVAPPDSMKSPRGAREAGAEPGAGRSWRTLIVFAVYLIVWYLVLSVET